MTLSTTYKIIITGDGGVGKTTLLHRYIKGKFIANTIQTMGVEFFTKEVNIEDIHVMLQIWDFAGQEEFRFMLDDYSIGASGAILMVDLTRYNTTDSIPDWLKICRKYDSEIPVVLVGSKLDLEDQLVLRDGELLNLQEQYQFIDALKTSSKTGENVEKLFGILARHILIKNELIQI